MFGSSVDEGVARGERREFLISDYHVPAGPFHAAFSDNANRDRSRGKA
jgi:hypothetical protein